MMESGIPICNSCGDAIESLASGEVFVACHGCNYPLCKQCLDEELKEGKSSCSRCGETYLHATEKVNSNPEESGGRSTMADHLHDYQDDGLHARNLSSFSAADSELMDESGNPIWKNRVESWREKKNKKKDGKKIRKEAQIPLEQQMEGKETSEVGQPLSAIIPVSPNKLTPYRAVIILRLAVLGLFFHYRITNPVDSAYGLWLTSIICEIWFAFSWILDQFPKWSPIGRETYVDQLSARYERDDEVSGLAAVDFFVSTVDPLKEPPLITANTVLSILAVDYPVDKVSCYVSDGGSAMGGKLV